jgi:glycosyltransferase involved in cell wall biosynthesis
MAEIELVGHFNSYVGVGEAARRLARLLAASGFGLSLGTFEKGSNRSFGDLVSSEIRSASANTVVSCVNPDQLGALLADHTKLLTESLNHIGFWAWELPDFPKAFRSAFSFVDSVWTVSDFAAAAIGKNTAVSVAKVTLPVPIPSGWRKGDKRHFGISERDFVVLSSFDFKSNFERKNPIAGVEAFKAAFKPDEGAILILKSSNSSEFPEQFDALKRACANRHDIRLISDLLPIQENSMLLDCADVFLSLHRAEGYGINLIDSMARGIPVVATGYSGNLDFMNERNSLLVPYELSQVEHYGGVKIQSSWAEPDIGYAAARLRELFLNQKFYETISHNAYRDVVDGHSLPNSVKHFRNGFTNAGFKSLD